MCHFLYARPSTANDNASHDSEIELTTPIVKGDMSSNSSAVIFLSQREDAMWAPIRSSHLTFQDLELGVQTSSTRLQVQ